MATISNVENKASLGPALIREIEAAIKRFNIYPPGHPASKTAAEVPYNTLMSLLDNQSPVIIGLMREKLAVNEHPVEDLAGKSVLEEALKALNLHSISFGADIKPEDFQKFLGYFIGKTGGRVSWDSLEEYISNKRITGIGLDELHYELVGKDQAVVDANAVVFPHSGGVPVDELLSKYPELVLGLLGDKESARGGISKKYAHAIDFEKLARGIEEELGKLSDEQVIQIITASLRDHIKNAEDYDEVDLQETLFKINEILEKRNRAELIPRVKQLFEELHLIDKKFLDMIIDKDYSRKKLALQELEVAREALEQGAMLTGKMAAVAKRLEIYDDQQYIEQFLGGLTNKLNTNQNDWQEIGEGFTQVLDGAVESKSENCLKELYRLVLENLEDYNLDNGRFTYYMQKAAKLVEWMAAEDNLPLLKEMFDVISVYTSEELTTSVDKRQAVQDFYESAGPNFLVGNLLKNLEKNFEALNRITFNILKQMQTPTVALKLCDYLNYPERSVRLFVIRLLSEFRDFATRAFQKMILDKRLQDRPPGKIMLEEQKWYKLRNIIFISGNIASPDAIEILEGIVSDHDPRVAEEMILALERIKSERACDMLVSYLYFKDSKIRLKAAAALGNVGNSAYADKLIDAFHSESEVKLQMIPIIARLGQENSLPFFKQLLLEQKESVLKSIFGKSSDDFKLHILSALSKIPSQKTLELLDEFRSTFGKGLGSLLKSNRVLVAAEDAKRSIKARLEHQAVS